MSGWWRYVGVSTLIVAGSVALASTFLSREGTLGLIAAGTIAWVVQVAAFTIASKLRSSQRGFLLSMVGGMFGRLAVLGVLGVLVTLRDLGDAEGPLIMGTVTFLFALLLLEARFLKGGPNPTEGHEPA